ncbi:MAG TPA: 50S ribosomal protein L11 methyltransferase [Blastocatellia bacterium]|nr:50S ribosomal protein L11 methyltransferase [Blastocatellia bacterium]
MEEIALTGLAPSALIESETVSLPRSPSHLIAGLAETLVSKGRAHLENKQYNDALHCFQSALYLSPEHRGALLGLNRVHRKLIPRWHFEMLNDEERNSAFERALSKAITPSTTVLDIGSGSGLLAMMAARAGAKETISCEMNTPIAELAQHTVARNGYADRVIILDKKSTDMRVGVDMMKRADLLVTETVDCGLLGEGIVPSIAHARENLLKEDARIIPRAATVIAAVVGSNKLRGLNYADKAAGFDVSPINQYATAGYFPVRSGAFDYDLLAEPFEVFRFDFTRGVIAPDSKLISVPVKREGVCHAILFWFDMQLDDEISISNRPGSLTHWEQALQCLEQEVPVRAGATLTVCAEHDCSAVSFKLVEPGRQVDAGGE